MRTVLDPHAGGHERRFRLGELRPLLLDTTPGPRIGYVTDLRFTEANLAQLDALLAGVDLLYIECVFDDEDRELARRRNHLTARQAGSIARRLGARQLQPFHFSPRYEGAEERLRAQAVGAWRGDIEPDCPYRLHANVVTTHCQGKPGLGSVVLLHQNAATTWSPPIVARRRVA